MKGLSGRVVSIGLAAVAGSAFGNALHKRLHSPGNGQEVSRPPIPIPVVNSIAATVVGLISHVVIGRRGWVPAFAFGSVSTALTGPALDRMLLPADQSSSASDTNSSHSSE